MAQGKPRIARRVNEKLSRLYLGSTASKLAMRSFKRAISAALFVGCVQPLMITAPYLAALHACEPIS
jgi:hypothetical protein